MQGFKDKMSKILKQKNITNLIILLLLVIMFYLVVSYFTGVNNITKSEKTNLEKVSKEDMNSNSQEDSEVLSYQEKQEKDLEKILGKINGVGSVDVVINFQSSEVKVPAVDNSSQKSTTEETDSEGGTRVNSQETDGDKIVMSNSSNGSEPVILKTEKPEVLGVMVVAEGAEDSKIKYEITKAISSLYNISVDKVNVLAMKK
ncbi:MAG: stage III sporulation protein AG [Clostridium perfringens]|uniref:Stage III sporulation protein AG n=2 Tax=Clostridium perfringens TaxID=1502 RepID=A0AAW4J0T0_CLOPF|nr:stage III sporulation protein AG [Clostridium perfringens]EHP48367.1 stage III sporulation protein AG [Clostridium perfringens WAL-14572]EGT5618254.1 stage III sporulation protein AG [Clostridium perfringens]MBO3355319.1 stage III sporulation protein AG [Clostridium perfringens]MBO3358590.1 stage III sporulation protein AG [Clostridium perfringens]MCX0415275.1 stage III sporulation protein AG [Clostridium perfringens]